MAANVNLDALIPREDFEIVDSGEESQIKQSMQITELERGAFFYGALRKPDFQRETAEWDPKRVVGLIRTFIEGDLIPGVILWQNKGLLFVIDGSHRLSALIAWVQNDYGDGPRSQEFFNHLIPEEQLKVAGQTRELVEKEFGSYQAHRDAIVTPESYGPDIVRRARRLATLSLQLQWVRGDAGKAEQSFIRINQQAVNITPQELELIRTRRKPNTIAARAIIRRGTGHKYWSGFQEQFQEGMASLVTELHQMLFAPALRYPIKTLDLPAGGDVYAATALRMVYDFVNVCVGAPAPDDDTDGKRTVEYLTRCRRVLRLVLSNDPSSLGLHPAVYFYSWTGNQQPILFLTVSSLVIDLERKKRLKEFTRVRKEFEALLMSNRQLLNQLIRKFGTKDSGEKHLRGYYDDVLELLWSGTPSTVLVAKLREKPKYSYLQPAEEPYEGVASERLSTKVKSGVVMKELLDKAPRCGICGAVISSQAISIDHVHRREDGGASTAENAQMAHPYCNTGYKESLHARSKGEGSGTKG